MNKACLNCGAENDSKFCKECGQSMHTHRLTVGHIMHEISHYFTHADKGLIYIIKEMFIRPGTVVEEYIAGKRKKYFNPYTFLLLCSTISAYIYYKIKYYSNIQIQQSPSKTGAEMNKLMMQASALMEQYGKLITLLMLPILGAISLLFYARKNLNYAEHLTIQTFILAQTSVINIFVTLFSYYVFPDSYFFFNAIFQLVFLLYLAIIFSKVFKEHFLLSLLKSLGFLLIFILAYWILALSGVSVYNYLTK
jgi:Protein of unknown function (DUF3667)